VTPGTAGAAPSWTLADVPDLSGRRALVTGVTSGLGETVALELARAGAEVVLAARSPDKLDATEAHLRRQLPDARLRRLRVDLADLGSVRRAAAEASALGPLHLLVNNAGVMATPYQRTVDGFELQLATNHLGPFALTGLLLPALVASGDARVVSTGSQAHRMARRAPLGDPRAPRGRYSRWEAYAQSKLAHLMFAFELDRRLHAAGLPVVAVAAHPGFSATGLMSTGLGEGGSRATRAVLVGAFRALGQPPRLGALPTLMAATADLPGGSYVGPRDFFQMRGQPRLVGARRLARDPDARRRLWELSEAATGVSYP
jgi:NAD(P)-dependent dehydrogenase (short-subunit alcohol dehydrogenase family)